jgi:CBS domain-containing protein
VFQIPGEAERVDPVDRHEAESRQEPEQKRPNLAQTRRAGRAYERQTEGLAPAHPLTVEKIMSKPAVTISEFDRVQEVREFVKGKNFRHFPVVGADGSLVGILSDRDLLGSLSGDTKISELMSQRVFTVDPQARIREVIAFMLDEKISCFPVLATDRSILGIVTRTDILKSLLIHNPVEVWR